MGEAPFGQGQGRGTPYPGSVALGNGAGLGPSSVGGGHGTGPGSSMVGLGYGVGDVGDGVEAETRDCMCPSIGASPCTSSGATAC